MLEASEAVEKTVIRTQQRLLQVASSQISAAIRDSESEADALAKGLRELASVSSEENSAAASTDIANECMIMMQFHDRMVQRLEHASKMVGLLGERLETQGSIKEKVNVLFEWTQITKELRTCYTSERERRLFDAILKHGPDSEAANEATSYAKQVSQEERIELF